MLVLKVYDDLSADTTHCGRRGWSPVERGLLYVLGPALPCSPPIFLPVTIQGCVCEFESHSRLIVSSVSRGTQKRWCFINWSKMSLIVQQVCA